MLKCFYAYMNFNWEKIFQLVKRTGDKLIVCDSATDAAVVVMDLEKYEKLLARAEWGGDDGADVDFADVDEVSPSETRLAEDSFVVEDEGNDKDAGDDLYYLEPVA